MATPRTSEQCRDQFTLLIGEAMAEPALERRTALLTMADHWAEIFRLRRTQEALLSR